MKHRILINLWLLLPGHANFSPSEIHWERLIEIGQAWTNLEYENPMYPAIFLRKHDTDETTGPSDAEPSTSTASKAVEDEPDTDPFVG